MNLVDLAFAVVLLLAALRGYSKGLLGTAAGYLAPVLGVMVAADWSDPVRDQIRIMWPDGPDIALDMLAPVVVFFLVVIGVRLLAAIFGKLLGVGLSAPGRVLAASASMIVAGIVLGAGVLVVREVKPDRPPVIDGESAREISPLEKLVVDVDTRMNESFLAPPMAEFASALFSEFVSRQEESPLVDPQMVEDATREVTEAAAREAAAVAATAAAAAVSDRLGESPKQSATAPAGSAASAGKPAASAGTGKPAAVPSPGSAAAVPAGSPRNDSAR